MEWSREERSVCKVELNHGEGNGFAGRRDKVASLLVIWIALGHLSQKKSQLKTPDNAQAAETPSGIPPSVVFPATICRNDDTHSSQNPRDAGMVFQAKRFKNGSQQRAKNQTKYD